MMNKIKGRILVSTASAIARPHSLPPSALINIGNAKAKVYSVLLFKISNGQNYSFQALIKNIILMEITDGLTKGRIMCHKIYSGEAPSKMAHS